MDLLARRQLEVEELRSDLAYELIEEGGAFLPKLGTMP